MSTPTILCVDDERNVLMTLQTQLMQHFPNYVIEIAESGNEALMVLEELLNDGVEIPLVIADQVMPVMKGDQMLIELHRRYPQILKVMLTGEALAEDVENVVNHGNLYRFMSKPWNEIDLQLTVTEALRCYHQQQQLTQKQIELEQTNRELERLKASLERQIQERTAQLNQNERQLRLFIEHTPVSVAMFDRHMNYLIASHRWVEDYQLIDPSNQLGDSIIGKCHYDLFPNISDSWREGIQSGLQGIATRNEKDHCIFADGREAWLRWEVLPWYDDTDTIAGLIVFGEIINNRIRTENALQESEECYRLLSEISPMGIFQYNTQGAATYANAKALQITGLSLEDNLSDGWVRNLHPDERDQMSAAWRNFIELANLGSNTEYEVEQRYLYPDGSQKWIFVQAIPERDMHGKLIGFISSILDITNRKQVEEALHQSE
ncbi:MAG: PAS domain S-box protein, partial [Pseudanabaena sp.]